jgi:hypothetical protein
VPSRKQRSGPPVRQTKVSRRQAREAREQLAADGLSHQERRRLRSLIRSRDAVAGRRSREFRHITIVLAGALAAMAVIAVLVGLRSAIKAASGQGTTGTFVAGYQWCSHRTGCALVGTFRSPNGATVPDVIYAGVLPARGGAGMSFAAIEPGRSDYVYPPHGSTVWISDLVFMAVIGAAVGFLLWLSPLGLRRRNTSHTGFV